LSDALGSTIALTDPTGAIREQYSYDPYGNVTASDTTTGFTNPYQYMGREADSSGLYYYRARYYSPQLPGFISEDPIGFAGGQLSFYAAFGSDPIDYSDPLGLQQYEPAEERDDEIEPWARALGPNQAFRPDESEVEKEKRWQECPGLNRLPEDDSQLKHIFRDAPGHIEDNLSNRNFLTNLTNNMDNLDGPDKYGNDVYTEPLPDGTQAWAMTRNGVIQNGGINQQPWTYIPNYGLVPGK
jgi:RHS repeat-associated protein